MLFSGIALGDVLSGVIHRRNNAGKAHNGTAARKPAHIANLRHQLDGSGFAHTVHGPDHFILRKLLGQPGHHGAQNSQRGLFSAERKRF